jgi:hypothetical protein
MKPIFASALSILALAASLQMASAKQVSHAATAMSSVSAACFQGDTMQRDGGWSGDLGAPKC